MNLPRLISTDFDGTLIDEQPESPVAQDFFDLVEECRSRGGAWVINTGRDWESLQSELLSRRFPVWPDWVVLVEREIRRVSFGNAVELFEWNERCNLLHRQLFATVEPLWQKIESFVSQNTGAELIVDIGSPLGIIAQDENEADVISQYIESLLHHWPNLDMVRNTVYFRFSHSYYNKGSCLQAISRELGIHARHTFAAGDHLNDIPMLRREHAHYLACPSNAIPQVKDIVRSQGGFVADRAQAPGIVDALKYFRQGPPL